MFNFVLWCGRSLPPAQDEFQKDVKSGMMDVVQHQREGMGGNDRYYFNLLFSTVSYYISA